VSAAGSRGWNIERRVRQFELGRRDGVGGEGRRDGDGGDREEEMSVEG
jgi:hypothetical protein